MGVSTDAHLCYGVKFEEDTEFQWDDDEEFDGDIDFWWECQFDEELDDDDFLKHHPLPVTLVNYQHCDAPAYILAVPSSVETAWRGEPTQIDATALSIQPSEWDALDDFIRTYIDPEYDVNRNVPHWWLSSYTDF